MIMDADINVLFKKVAIVMPGYITQQVSPNTIISDRG